MALIYPDSLTQTKMLLAVSAKASAIEVLSLAAEAPAVVLIIDAAAELLLAAIGSFGGAPASSLIDSPRLSCPSEHNSQVLHTWPSKALREKTDPSSGHLTVATDLLSSKWESVPAHRYPAMISLTWTLSWGSKRSLWALEPFCWQAWKYLRYFVSNSWDTI